MNNIVEIALEIAQIAHEGQLDRGGNPYINHPLYVASQMEDDEAKAVALLHDTVEDSDVTIEDLKDAQFSENVVNAVDAITKRQVEDYETYIQRLSKNTIATHVKIADMKHNSDLSRIENPSEADKKRIEKYNKTIKYLQDLHWDM